MHSHCGINNRAPRWTFTDPCKPEVYRGPFTGDLPKGTGPGVRRTKRPLSACHTRRKCSMETTQNSLKGRVRYKVWSVGGCLCIWSGHRMSFNICARESSYCLIRSSNLSVKLRQWRFQALLTNNWKDCVSLHYILRYAIMNWCFRYENTFKKNISQPKTNFAK